MSKATSRRRNLPTNTSSDIPMDEQKKVRDVPGVRKCENCGEQYEVREKRLAMPGTRDWELIACPYCDHTVLGRTNGYWEARKTDD